MLFDVYVFRWFFGAVLSAVLQYAFLQQYYVGIYHCLECKYKRVHLVNVQLKALIKILLAQFYTVKSNVVKLASKFCIKRPFRS